MFLFLFFVIISEKILVVTELIPYGSLKNFLISKRIACVSGEASRYVNVRFGLNDRALLKIAFQIALGMQFLEKKKVREYTCNYLLTCKYNTFFPPLCNISLKHFPVP